MKKWFLVDVGLNRLQAYEKQEYDKLFDENKADLTLVEEKEYLKLKKELDRIKNESLFKKLFRGTIKR